MITTTTGTFTATSTVAVDLPASAAAGRTLLVWVQSDGGAYALPPAGWTQESTFEWGPEVITLLSRSLSGAESDPTNVTLDGPDDGTWIAVVVPDPVPTIGDWHDYGTEPASLTPGGAGDQYLVHAWHTGPASPDPAGDYPLLTDVAGSETTALYGPVDDPDDTITVDLASGDVITLLAVSYTDTDARELALPGGVVGASAGPPRLVTGEALPRFQAFVSALPTPTVDIGELEDVVAGGTRFLDQYNEPGSGSVELDNADPDNALLGDGRCVRFRIHGQVAFGIAIGPSRSIELHPSEEIAYTTVWSGDGLLALLRLGIVYPTLGPGVQPVEDDRVFNFANLLYDASGWAKAKDVSEGLLSGSDPHMHWPPGWPDKKARLIWGPSGTREFARGGPAYFRHTFTTAEDGKFILYWIADNYGSIWVDGVQLDALASDQSGNYNTTHQVDLTLSAGTHVLAARVVNVGPQTPDPSDEYNPGALMASLYTAKNGKRKQLVTYTRPKGWKVSEYPDVTPGFTVGEVLRLLVGEVHARLGITFIRLGFTDLVDSMGHPWSEVSDIAVKVGTDLLTFIRQLVETHIDVWLDPTTFTLHATRRGKSGRNTGIPYAPADPLLGPEGAGNLTMLQRDRG